MLCNYYTEKYYSLARLCFDIPWQSLIWEYRDDICMCHNSEISKRSEDPLATSFRYFHFNGAGSWMCVNFRAAFKNAHSRFPRRRRVTVCTCDSWCIIAYVSWEYLSCIFRDESSHVINHPINSLLSMSNVLNHVPLKYWNIAGFKDIS